MPLMPGTRLANYEIVSALGAGGMGEVYRARDPRLDRDVAIKVLSADAGERPAALARFEREAMSVARLSHPNILSIFEFAPRRRARRSSSPSWSTARRCARGSQRGPLPPRRAVALRAADRTRAWRPRTRAASCIAISSPRT